MQRRAGVRVRGPFHFDPKQRRAKKRRGEERREEESKEKKSKGVKRRGEEGSLFAHIIS